MMRRLAAPILMLAMLAFAVPAHADDTATVTILHGVPGLDVDVYANGDVLVPDFAPGDSFGPAELPAGDYDIAIRPAGADADSDPAIAASITVPADVNATVIAHLDADGTPTLTVYVNDVSAIDAGEARLAVRQTAAFGAVDVLADGDALISSLSNPDEAAMDVPAATYDVAVTAAGDASTEALRADLTLEDGTAYFVHAIGDPAEGTFDVLVQTVDGLHTPPSAVDTGTGGLAADRGLTLPITVALLAFALLGLGMATPALARRR